MNLRVRVAIFVLAALGLAWMFAAAVLELPAGALAAVPAEPGDRLSIAPRTDAAAER